MRTLGLLLLAVLVAAGCGNTAALESSQPGEPVMVDGDLSDWAGKLRSLRDGAFNIGVQNDDEYLYVSLSTRSPQAIAQFMQQGLILWIDRDGGKAQTFGVRHPIGVMQSGSGLGADPTANRILLEQSLQEVELIGETGQAFRRRKDFVPGMAVHAEAGDRVFTYEAKIPLAPAEGIAYAIGTEPGRQIGVGFETPVIEGSNVVQQQGAGGLPGGRMSSADGRNRYGLSGFPSTNIPPPIRQWVIVTLAD